jgi:hypothetical protein
MSTNQFIKQNQTSIQNIDGNLDQATITLMLEDGRLAFYWFEDGKYTKHIINGE